MFYMRFCLLYLFVGGFFFSVGAQNSSVPISPGALSETTGIDATLNFARGHRTFREVHFKQHEKEYLRLVKEGQDPQTLFIGCSDSRIVPDLILGTKPGDLFVIRTAGNFIPPYDSAAGDGVSATIQYALEALNIRHIIICGHSHCGAVEGLFKTNSGRGENILDRWLKLGEGAKEMTLKTVGPDISPSERDRIAGQISVVYQLEHLLTFPGIKKRTEEGSLQLHGWYYHMETGEVTYYDPELYRFIPLGEAKRA